MLLYIIKLSLIFILKKHKRLASMLFLNYNVWLSERQVSLKNQSFSSFSFILLLTVRDMDGKELCDYFGATSWDAQAET